MLVARSREDGSLAGFVDIDGREKKPGQSEFDASTTCLNESRHELRFTAALLIWRAKATSRCGDHSRPAARR